MRSQQVVTNETCNQNCAFCNARSPFEREAVAAFSRVALRIEAAVAGGAEEIVLTGGEPTLRRDLPRVVARARAAGAGRVVLETNAALLTDARAADLRVAGLDLARVHVPVWGEGADDLSRDEGGFARTLSGLRSLARAGIAIEIATPIVRRNLDRVAGIPPAIAASGLTVSALVLGVPVSGPDQAALAPLGEAAAAIERVEAAARPLGVRVRLNPDASVPPCLFARPGRLAHLFSLNRGGAVRPDHVPVGACVACAARSICPGLPRAALATLPAIHPIADDRTRRRLSMLATVDEQIARELVTRDVHRLPDGATVREHIVRVSFHCNQACGFCFVSTHLPPAEDAAVEAAIAEIAALRGVLILSGGEPTLNPRLLEYVEMGRRLGVRQVEIQTNAVRLADPELTRALERAGVDVAFVSLHASGAALSDRITAAPGTFDRTVAGIDELARTRIELRLNFVFCTQNQADFPAVVRMVAARWPRAGITVSFVAASTDVVPLDRELIPRFSDVMPSLTEGVRVAAELGVKLTGFESMCGIPLCQVPGDLSPYLAFAEAPPSAGEFVKAEVCRTCALGPRCFGVRRGYAALHGTDELRPVAPADVLVAKET
jgi:MoaA/NifB/PqqE/SkfB family radical SAM enzyme